MSETVDTRVVRMEFDNKQFEKNVKKTSQSLDNLKQNLDFGKVGDSINEVALRISALEIVATTFIANIANRITNLGINLVKSLSVDNISLGWAKFGEKTTSVATMMAQKIRIAGKEITDLGLKTEIVNKQLELLNWFSDETSYSFNDMVNNTGKFIAAGQDLDVSVKAMEGIATWAALSGQNAATASRAMYQLAQAMGKGKIQKIDWMSIQNANMDTEEFRATALATAVALGELTKEGDKFVTKTGKKFKQSEFADFLSEGWFTSEVLVKSLGKYSAAIEQIYEISEKEGLTASEVIEKYGDQLDEFGLKAFKAAQEARTFADVISSVKDAVSSKWLGTFEYIFGSEEEAVKLWTDLANELYDVFAEGGNFRNEVLSIWKDLQGRDDLFAKGGPNQGAFWNIYDAIVALKDLIKEAWDTIFPLSTMEDYDSKANDIANKFKKLTQRIRELTSRLIMSENTSARISKIFQGLFGIIKVGVNILRAAWYIINPLFDLGKRLVNEVLDYVSYYFSKIGSVGSKFEEVVIGIHDAIVDLTEAINPSGIIGGFFSLVQKIFKFISANNPITLIVDLFKSFRDGLKGVTNIGSDLSDFFDMLSSALRLVFEALKSIIPLVFKTIPYISKALNVIFRVLGFGFGVISKIVGSLSRLFNVLLDYIEGLNLFEKIATITTDILTFLKNLITPLLSILKKAGSELLNLAKNIILLVPKIIDSIKNFLENSNILKSMTDFFSAFINAIIDFVKSFNGTMKPGGGFTKAFVVFFKGLSSFVKSMGPVLQSLTIGLGVLLESVAKVIDRLLAMINSFASGEGTQGLTKMIRNVALVVGAFILVFALLYRLGRVTFSIQYILDQVGDMFANINKKLTSMIVNDLVNNILKLSAALLVISTIKEEDLIRAIAALSVLSLLIFTIISAFTGIAKAIKKSRLKRSLKATAEVVSKLSSSLLKISIALLFLSNIPVDTLWACVGALAALSAVMVAMTFTISSMKKVSKNGSKTFSKVASSLLIFSLVIALLVRSTTKLADLDQGKMWSAVGAIAVFTVLLTSMSLLGKYMKSAKMIAFSQALILFSAAITLMSIPILLLGALDYGKVWNGVAAIIVLTGLIALVMKLADVISAVQFPVFSASLIAFAIAMELMAGVIATLAALEYGKVWNGVAVISAFLGLAALIIKLIGIFSTFKFGVFSTALIKFAAAMSILSVCIVTLGSMKEEDSTRGRRVIQAFLATVAMAIKLIGILSALKLGVFSASLIKFTAAMAALTTVIAALGYMNTVSLWKGIGAMAAMAAGIVLLSSLLTATKSTFSLMVLATGMTLFATAMVPFVSALALVGGIDFKDIGMGMLVMASSLLVLIAAAALSKNLIGAIVALSASMLLIGVGLMAAGVGMSTIAVGLEALCLAIITNAPLIAEAVSLVATILVDSLMSSIVNLVSKIAEAVPYIIEAFGAIVGGLIDLLTTYGPRLVELVVGIIDDSLRVLNEHGESIWNSIFGIINTMLTKLVENVGPIADNLFKFLLGILSKLKDYIPDIVYELVGILENLIIALFDGERGLPSLLELAVTKLFKFIGDLLAMLLSKIVVLAGLIAKLILTFISAALKIVIASLGTLGRLLIIFIGALISLVAEIFVGMGSVIFSALKYMMSKVLHLLVDVIAWSSSALGLIGEAILRAIMVGLLNLLTTSFKWVLQVIDWIAGTTLVKDLENGISNISNTIMNGAHDVIDELGGSMSEIQSAMQQTGSDITGIVSMASEEATKAVANGAGAITNAVATATEETKEAISEMAFELGEDISEGTAAGIESGGSDVNDAVEQVGNDAIDTIKQTTETHSPSRVFQRIGGFLMKGLSLGISDSSEEVDNTMVDVISRSIELANSILENQNGDDITIKVGMDISSVENQTARISEIMSGINNPSLTAAGINANYNASVASRNGSKAVNNPGSTTNNSNEVVYNNVFNITSNDPQQTAEEIDRTLQEQARRYKLAHGT